MGNTVALHREDLPTRILLRSCWLRKARKMSLICLFSTILKIDREKRVEREVQTWLSGYVPDLWETTQGGSASRGRSQQETGAHGRELRGEVPVRGVGDRNQREA